MTSKIVESIAPIWYREDEILEAIKTHAEWRWLPPEKAAFIARHLQLAFSKGFQVRGHDSSESSKGAK